MAAATLPAGIDPKRRLVLVTVHRRENWVSLPDVCAAIRAIVEARPEVQVAVPVHPNPIVQETISRELRGTDRVVLLPALDYLSFIKVMSESWIVLTDSGGVQEEAPVLGKPVLVMREETERPEAVDAGAARIVGTRREGIVAGVLDLLASDAARERMAQPISPFGDGRAAGRIADAIEQRRGEIEAFRSREGNPRARDVGRNVHVEK